ncbi:MAG TPA: hypothetical protein VIW25_08995 [Nitrososphaeraceae archaeon]
MILDLLEDEKKRLIYWKWRKGVKPGSGHGVMKGLTVPFPYSAHTYPVKYV